MENKNYELVELPSKGQCYPINSPLRKGKVKVKYLTAMDENILVSEKHIKEERICDVLLKNKVIDVNANELCAGDKEAIILWLRKTGYGNLYKKSSQYIHQPIGSQPSKQMSWLAIASANCRTSRRRTVPLARRNPSSVHTYYIMS